MGWQLIKGSANDAVMVDRMRGRVFSATLLWASHTDDFTSGRYCMLRRRAHHVATAMRCAESGGVLPMRGDQCFRSGVHTVAQAAGERAPGHCIHAVTSASLEWLPGRRDGGVTRGGRRLPLRSIPLALATRASGWREDGGGNASQYPDELPRLRHGRTGTNSCARRRARRSGLA
jgi:hypothetical protein